MPSFLLIRSHDADQLRLPPSFQLPPAMAAQLASAAAEQLLRQLVRRLLPAADAEGAAALPQQHPQAAQPPQFGAAAVSAFGAPSAPAFGGSGSTFGASPAFGRGSSPESGSGAAPAFGGSARPAFGSDPAASAAAQPPSAAADGAVTALLQFLGQVLLPLLPGGARCLFQHGDHPMLQSFVKAQLLILEPGCAVPDRNYVVCPGPHHAQFVGIRRCWRCRLCGRMQSSHWRYMLALCCECGSAD